jgi:hypothetical protein
MFQPRVNKIKTLIFFLSWHMHIACWIPKAADTHSVYVILTAFLLQHGYVNAPQCCVISTLPVCFLITKPTRCTNFSNLFCNETLHVSDSFSVHHQELFTVHSAVVYVIQVCRQLQFHPDPAARKLSTNLCDIYHC